MTVNEPSQSDRDRRAAPRYEVSTRAMLRSLDGASMCKVQDVSAVGAGLLLSADAIVPDTFELVTRSGVVYPVEVAWRAYPKCGVAFVRLRTSSGVDEQPGESAVVKPWTRRRFGLVAPVLIALCLILAAGLAWYVLATPR